MAKVGYRDNGDLKGQSYQFIFKASEGSLDRQTDIFLKVFFLRYDKVTGEGVGKIPSLKFKLGG